MTKIAHISDIHWRSLKRHDEYRQVFSLLFDNLEKENPDYIFIGGDIVHSKTQGISPELIDNLTWTFERFAKIAPVHVILGNHDGLILNEDRQDAISPVINAMNNEKIYLYKKSGVYDAFILENGQKVNWCVFSCFDEKNWSNVNPLPEDINIACFHGAVRGSKTDVDWELEGEVNVNFFERFDFAFLGDIHKKQYLDQENRIAYPGSLIQQNYGEDVNKGFLIWEINSSYDYSSRFVKINNPHPFVTVDWKESVEDTLVFCEKIRPGCRFRIRSELEISQAEIKIIHHYLKNNKKAKEIVYQVLNKITDQIKFTQKTNDNNFNIRKSKERQDLIKDLYIDLSEEEIKSLDTLFKEKIDEIPEDFSSTNKKWSINSMHFDNTFSYGKNNFINFDRLNGVVGLFGNNRIGKSSIPGSIMYTLFNTTDRGSIKNQDIVNIRKGYCEATIELTVDDKQYLVTRRTDKKTNKKGETSSTTNLMLKRKDIEIDESEEQRRETDKILRSLIGNPEDFLYTSFASQGEMNTFISEKSSSRKSVLTNFLRLDIYDKLYKNSREDYIVLKNKLKSIKEENWDQIIKQCDENIAILNQEIDKNSDNLSKKREKVVHVNVNLSNLQNQINQHSSGFTLEDCQKELDFLNNKISTINKNIDESNDLINKNNLSLKKINKFKAEYPIESLESDKEKLDNLLENLKIFKYEKSILNNKKNDYEKEIKILDQVPCGDQFPTCKFIKKAHFAKKDSDNINQGIRKIEASIYEVNDVVEKLKSNNIKEKISKYNEVLNKEYKLKVDIERLEEKIQINNTRLQESNKKLQYTKKILLEIEDLNNDTTIEKIKSLKTELNEIQREILKIESQNKEKSIENFSLESKISNLLNKKEEHKNLVKEWKTCDLFSFAVSKKGIPAMIINSCLPRINNEINNVLNGVTSFKVEVLEDQKNNNLNVYIDYGDSQKRIIECASGMEKMIASIAIRVALINISSLPRSNIFIIDEGFGALDDSNIEACARLLISLKKYFKTILIISHVDEIKDIVDKNIEINLKGHDSYVEYR